MTLHDRGSFRKNSALLSPTSPGSVPLYSTPSGAIPSDQRTWNQSQTTNKALDYLCLLQNLSETVPGSHRKLTKKPSFVAFHSGDYEHNSVLSSDAAKPRADHDLKVLQRLKSGELENVKSVEQYRKSLVIEKKKKNSILQSAIDFTRPKSLQHQNSMGSGQQLMTKSEYIKAGEVLNSPLNPDRPGNHIAMMEKLRKLKYHESFESIQDDDWNGEGNEEDRREEEQDQTAVLPTFHNGPNWEDSLEDGQQFEHHHEEKNLENNGSTDQAAESSTEQFEPDLLKLKISKKSKSHRKYLVDSTTPSPFLNENGTPLPTKKFVQSKQPNHFMSPLARDRPSSPSQTTESFPVKEKTKPKKKKQRSASKKLAIDTSFAQHQVDHQFPTSPLLQQKFKNQSAGLDVLCGLDSQESYCQADQRKTSSPSVELMISTAEEIQDIPPKGLPKSSSNRPSTSKRKKKKSSSNPDHLSPKFSKAYYELCTLRIQRESQISWDRLKKKEAYIKKQQLKSDERAQLESERSLERDETLMNEVVGMPLPSQDEILAENTNRSDDDTISDFTIQEFIGLQLSRPSATSSVNQPKKELRDSTTYQYLLRDAPGYHESQSTTNRDEEKYTPPEQVNPSLSLRIDRDDLISAQDLENLSQAPSQSLDSMSGLLSTDGLVNMKISVNDPLTLISPTSPQDVIAKCIGKLLFSETQNNLRIRPASAGIGGISRPKIYSSVLAGVRPMSGHKSATYKGSGGKYASQEELLNGKLYSHETKRRNVIERSLPADRWLT